MKLREKPRPKEFSKPGSELGVLQPLSQPPVQDFSTAKKWNFYSSYNPASGVTLPEKQHVRDKRLREPAIIPRLLDVLKEPARTMVEL
jgi:hypothetical protein